MVKNLCSYLHSYAEQYETSDFLKGDPSWWMHQVEGGKNQEAMAFIASCLSYGSRKQFMPKIGWIKEKASGEVHDWVLSGDFEKDLPHDDLGCFYRLYNIQQMNEFLRVYQSLLKEYGTLGNYVRKHASTGILAIETIYRYFAERGVAVIIPKDTKSACKRVCMFLRWMVRSGSSVDLGLWSDFIDRRTLVMPLDTHVLSQSVRLGLLTNKTASMSVAQRLTARLAEYFPDDPLKGDFALFGYGVNFSDQI